MTLLERQFIRSVYNDEYEKITKLEEKLRRKKMEILQMCELIEKCAIDSGEDRVKFDFLFLWIKNIGLEKQEE